MLTTDTLQPQPAQRPEFETLDNVTAEAFAERLLNILNSGAIAHMLSIGHRTELLDTLALLAAATSEQIAEAAGLNERYVREWLGAMVTGHIVQYDPAALTYYLPAEHAAFLTRSASPDNIAAFMQYIPMMGTVEDAIIDCFYHGGGVPYSAYNRFHEIMAEDSGQTVVAALEDHILPLVPGLQDQLTQGITVADVGCGRGRALQRLAQLFPHSQFIGYDISTEAIAWATQESQHQGLKNITFKQQDAATISVVEQYDLILTFDAIHDQAKPDDVLVNIHRALRTNGLYLMQDIRATSDVGGNIEHPIGPLLYTISCNHCMSVSLAAGGPGLGAMWGEELAISMLQTAGFTHVEVKQSEHDFQNNYYIVQK